MEARVSDIFANTQVGLRCHNTLCPFSAHKCHPVLIQIQHQYKYRVNTLCHKNKMLLIIASLKHPKADATIGFSPAKCHSILQLQIQVHMKVQFAWLQIPNDI